MPHQHSLPQTWASSSHSSYFLSQYQWSLSPIKGVHKYAHNSYGTDGCQFLLGHAFFETGKHSLESKEKLHESINAVARHTSMAKIVKLTWKLTTITLDSSSSCVGLAGLLMPLTTKDNHPYGSSHNHIAFTWHTCLRHTSLDHQIATKTARIPNEGGVGTCWSTSGKFVSTSQIARKSCVHASEIRQYYQLVLHQRATPVKVMKWFLVQAKVPNHFYRCLHV